MANLAHYGLALTKHTNNIKNKIQRAIEKHLTLDV